ncbi:MAG: prepilin-type N-terminal cleavage/methylation domain-containing protein [Candidatus Saccharimonadales bacterium]
MSLTKSTKQSNGFTIIELVVVMAIIGILASISIVGYGSWRQSITTTQLKSDLHGVAAAMENARTFGDEYPASIPATFTPSLGVSLSGGSYDGNSYCIEAVSTEDASVKYHVSDGSSTTQSGGCPFTSFVVRWGGTGNDLGNATIKTSDGGFAITGNTYSFGGGGSDMFLAKYNSDGTLSWDKTWGGSRDDVGRSLVETKDGGILVTGNTSSYGTAVATMYYADIFLAKYNSDGDLLWSNTWGGPNIDDSTSIAQSNDGSILIVGRTASYGAGANDILIAKFSAGGNFMWGKTWGGPSQDYGNAIAQASDGGVVVTGYTQSYGAGTHDMIIAKFSYSDGTLLWNNVWGGASTDIGNSIVKTNDGGMVVTGRTDSFAPGSGDMFIAKYSTDGTLIWDKTWGGTGQDYGNSIVQTANGDLSITGYTYSYGAGGSDMFLAKYSSDGNLLWNRTWGGLSSGDTGKSIIQTSSDGGFAVTGVSYSYSAGLADMFLAKYSTDGIITNCSSPMCQDPTATVADPIAAFSSPTAAVSNQTGSVTNPTPADVSPDAILEVIVAP